MKFKTDSRYATSKHEKSATGKIQVPFTTVSRPQILKVAQTDTTKLLMTLALPLNLEKAFPYMYY